MAISDPQFFLWLFSFGSKDTFDGIMVSGAVILANVKFNSILIAADVRKVLELKQAFDFLLLGTDCAAQLEVAVAVSAATKTSHRTEGPV